MSDVEYYTAKAREFDALAAKLTGDAKAMAERRAQWCREQAIREATLEQDNDKFNDKRGR